MVRILDRGSIPTRTGSDGAYFKSVRFGLGERTKRPRPVRTTGSERLVVFLPSIVLITSSIVHPDVRIISLT